ncbi:SMP-30/gluconolactonase/LRE family protein [Muricoccus radiodurans]|uniref:SMP-30/gluconolactonase/LRE family protein n=1 Tax=Muricoccus radiodurans TaxID=2231721 RepID=UPI003CF2E866
MLGLPPTITATPIARLPEALHWRGEPNDWVRATRPGQRLHSFLEGLSLEADGTAWMVDVPYGRILRVSCDGVWQVAHEYDGEPHGLLRLPDGAFVVADYRRGLLRLENGALTPILSRVNTENFRGLSDLCRGPDGSLWFTDSGRSSLSDPTGRIFRLRPDGALDLVLNNLPYPNGLALSQDGRFLHVAVTRANAVWRLLADAPDPLLPMVGTYLQLSGGLGPDGLAMDGRGRLAVAHAQAGTAWLFDPLGFPLLRIRTPGGLWTTSVAFSADSRTLFILEAQAGALHRVDLHEALPEESET